MRFIFASIHAASIWAPMSLAASYCFAAPEMDQVRAVAPDSSEYVVFGKIVDYTGRHVVVTTANGSDQRIPVDRILKVSTERSADFASADAAFTAEQWEEARALYERANVQETRIWARRQILSQMARCDCALGRNESAGEMLSLVLESDPTADVARLAPLAWTSDEAVPVATAERWLRHQQPLVNVWGAASLWETPRRDEARGTLERLSRDARATAVARSFAAAQLWRGRMAEARADEVDVWSQQLAEMPAECRGGPHYVLARAYERLGQESLSIMHYLQQALMFPEQRSLAARSLWAASRLLSGQQRGDEAQRVLDALLADFPQSAEAAALRRAGDSAIP